MRGFDTIILFYFHDGYEKILLEIFNVNIFRVLFNSYFNADFEILENRHMWYSNDQTYNHTKISEIFKKT